MAKYRKVASVYKKESEFPWGGVITVFVVLVVIGAIIG